VKLCKSCLFRAPDERAICLTCGATSFEKIDVAGYVQRTSSSEFKAFVVTTIEHARRSAVYSISIIRSALHTFQGQSHRRSTNAIRSRNESAVRQTSSVPVLLRDLK
jgi:hypothetical protein